MSVSPSIQDLPGHRIPKRLQQRIPKAGGNDANIIWSMGEGPFAAARLASGLQLRPDPNNSEHGFVEPDDVMPLADYQAALAGTQSLWSVDEETE